MRNGFDKGNKMNSGKVKKLRMAFSQLFEWPATHTEGRPFMKYLKFALVLGVFTLTAIPEQAMAARSITAKELSSVCASEIRLARTERIQFHKDYAEYLKRNPEIPDAKKSRAEIIEGLSYISRKDLSDIDWYMWQTEDWIKKNHDVLSVQKQI